jgi:hypothetical protein
MEMPNLKINNIGITQIFAAEYVVGRFNFGDWENKIRETIRWCSSTAVFCIHTQSGAKAT